ncbi:MAG: DUF2079 domain-containing protein [Thermoplasmataceae archaeon]
MEKDAVDTSRARTPGKRLYLLLLVAGFLLYNAAWIYVSYIRYTSLNYSVWDLGVNYERSWQVLHGSLTTFPDLVGFISTNFIVVILSPLSMLNQLSSLLVAQLVALDFSAILIYKISMIILKDRWKSAALSTAFLFYPPLAGITWFDFHYQVFFIPFFLAGYLFYLRGNYVASGVMMVLSGTVRFPYMVFPLLFSVSALVSQFMTGSDKRSVAGTSHAVILLIVTAVLLVIGYKESNGMEYVAFLASSFGGITPFAHTPLTILITLFFILAFLLFQPLISRKWLPFLIPYVVLIIISTNTYFIYPQFFHRQYGGIYIPFMFLGLIDSVIVLERYLRNHKFRSKRIMRKVVWLSKHSVTAVLVLMLVAIPFFQPYGPLNFASPNNFYFEKEIAGSNISQVNGLNTIIALIPSNATEILIQNNLPEYFPRPLYNNTVLAPPIVSFQNFSLYSIQNDRFNVTGLGGVMVSFPLQYVLLDYRSSQFTAGNPSMKNMSEMMFESGYYGVYAQDGLIVLLERGYSGPPVIMVGNPYFT